MDCSRFVHGFFMVLSHLRRAREFFHEFCLLMRRAREFFVDFVLFCRAAWIFCGFCLILQRGHGFERRARLYPYRFSMLGINLRVAFFNFKRWVSECRGAWVARGAPRAGKPEVYVVVPPRLNKN